MGVLPAQFVSLMQQQWGTEEGERIARSKDDDDDDDEEEEKKPSRKKRASKGEDDEA